MKRFANLAVLMSLAIVMTGCFVWVKETCPPENATPPQLASDSTIAEIDAARTLTTNDSRENVLVRIAARHNLSPQARAHLAKSVDMLTTNASRENVLMTLAENEWHPDPIPQPEPAPTPQNP